MTDLAELAANGRTLRGTEVIKLGSEALALRAENATLRSSGGTDSDKIMAEHRPIQMHPKWCAACNPNGTAEPTDWPCLPYRLAGWLKIAEDEHKRLTAENAALRAAIERVGEGEQ